MSNKLVKCKSCGREIAKNAKSCPSCGAKQHQGAYIATAVVSALAVIAVIGVIDTTLGGNETDLTAAQNGSSVSQKNAGKEQKITFSGKQYSAEYNGCSDPGAVQGAFYVNLKIKNTGDSEQFYMLEDVYVDETHCSTGTGLPVTALSGKNANGAFIVFCKTPLKDVKKVEFKLHVKDNQSMKTIEKSEVITVYPNS